MGSTVKKATSYTAGAIPFGGGGKAKDVIFGKEKVKKKSEFADAIKKLQWKGIKGTGTAFDTMSGGLKDLKEMGPATGAVRKSIARQEKGLLTSADDQRRKVQGSIARRGLGSSSLGMRAESGISRSLGDSLSALRATTPERIRQAKLNQIQNETNMGGTLFAAGRDLMPKRVQMNDVNLGRQGGLLGIAQGLAPMAGAAIGGAYGGPQGAAMGAQLGSAAGQSAGGLRTTFG